MRVHAGILTVVLVAALSGCSDGSDKAGAGALPSVSMTEVTLECDRFADTARAISDAQAALYSGSGDTSALDTLDEELAALGKDAPADVRAALDRMGSAFHDAETFLADPTSANKAALAALAPKLAADSQKITAYITAECE